MSEHRVVVHAAVEYPEETWLDSMDGRDEEHALQRLRNRWPHAEIHVIGVEE